VSDGSLLKHPISKAIWKELKKIRKHSKTFSINFIDLRLHHEVCFCYFRVFPFEPFFDSTQVELICWSSDAFSKTEKSLQWLATFSIETVFLKRKINCGNSFFSSQEVSSKRLSLILWINNVSELRSKEKFQNCELELTFFDCSWACKRFKVW